MLQNIKIITPFAQIDTEQSVYHIISDLPLIATCKSHFIIYICNLQNALQYI